MQNITVLKDNEIDFAAGAYNFLNGWNVGAPQAFGVGNIANLGNHNNNVIINGPADFSTLLGLTIFTAVASFPWS